MRKRSTPTSGSARVDAALVEADEARWCLPAGLVFAKSAARQRPYLYRVTGPPASERPRGPLPPIEASGTGVWAWVHLAFHGRCTTAAAGLARRHHTASRHQRNTWGMLVRRAMRSTSRGRLPSILVSLVLATMQTTCSPPEKHQKVRHTKRQYRLQQQSSTAI